MLQKLLGIRQREETPAAPPAREASGNATGTGNSGTQWHRVSCLGQELHPIHCCGHLAQTASLSLSPRVRAHCWPRSLVGWLPQPPRESPVRGNIAFTGHGHRVMSLWSQRRQQRHLSGPRVRSQSHASPTRSELSFERAGAHMRLRRLPVARPMQSCRARWSCGNLVHSGRTRPTAQSWGSRSSSA